MTAMILGIVVKASLIMGVAAALTLASRRASAARRHMIWTISIVALLALPVFALILPTLTIPVAAEAPISRMVSATENAGRPIAAHSRETAADSIQAAATSATPIAPSQPLPWRTILLSTYLLGVLGLSLKLAAEQLSIRGLARRAAEVADSGWLELAATCRRETGVVGPVRILRSLDRAMPMAFGAWKPTVLIPSIADTWNPGRRRAVLLHELSHVARRDCLTQLIARVACALYWPHPGAWLIARGLRMERELACDDRVIATGAAAPEYAQHLLELAYSLGGYRAPALVVSMARPKQLEGRMLAVLDHARNRTTPAARFRVAAFVAAGLIVMPLAAARISAIPAATYIGEKGAMPASDLEPATTEQSKNASQTYKRREVQLPGTWSIRTTKTPGIVSVQISERRNSNSGFDIALSELQGLTGSSLSGNGPVKFSIRRDAGTINFEGTIKSGVGAGTFDFTPSPTFAGEMAKRGYERPSNDDLYILARGDIGTAYLDELASQKYTRPTLDNLLRAGDHGVDLDYLREMGRAGYHLGQIESLIQTRDHGVDIEFINGLKAHGLSGLSVEQLVRARDHGVDPDYIGGMKRAGFELHDLDGLVRTRDHGVDPEYIAAMKDAGYDLRDLNGLVTARDHGVDPDYIQDMRRHGFKLSLVELINARDHGIDDEYVSGMAGLGYKDLAIGDLIRLRDHGVTPEWAKRQNARGSKLSVDELIRRRDRGGDN
jgi:beta-lactamase regulating signal transducer with metallopeptidase domain